VRVDDVAWCVISRSVFNYELRQKSKMKTPSAKQSEEIVFTIFNFHNSLAQKVAVKLSQITSEEAVDC
jgi:hypothetical protein